MENPNPSQPCPYAPFGIPCQKEYGHGSPHQIEIEAALVEVILKPKPQSAAIDNLTAVNDKLDEIYGPVPAPAQEKIDKMDWPT